MARDTTSSVFCSGFLVHRASVAGQFTFCADEAATSELPSNQAQSASPVEANATDAVSTEQVPTVQPVALPGVSAEGPSPAVAGSVDGDMTLRFAFSGAPWREVLRWLADESGLALHVGDLPVGSFTYSDPDEFTVDEAISRVNLFLIPQGFGVVKRGSLLSVISLADPRSLQQLDALAIRTSVSELKNYSTHEIVKCTVPVGDLVVDEVLAELQPLMLMTAPVVLPRTKQIIVTDTAARLKA